MKGYIHNYTGAGKGKTTSALGLALRALGTGKKVCIIQFFKNGDFSEIKALRQLKTIYKENLFFTQAGAERELFADITAQDRIAARHGEEQFFHLLETGGFDLFVLDEINTASHYGLIDPVKFLKNIEKSEKPSEIVMTGRYAPLCFLDAADLVTEMKKKKHYAEKGVMAREGIEF
ncbi:cob(I)yrinic acid a,c-diamide adenosyltransferase [Spirochaeta isovalerica]|uniref:corrinoid adenosyltransferase n=1 Tax=Spirochaeta isovalerica TaxID=150 RepID=A0A841R7B8_9SPIO|nr:cob(I)yrinic acid a,c-diamide adenosyltransferase [Spirochaeta isovalerica]MBB6478648.1 cob(I)alamin adenosyltransferase [Spirochaeta isovalerica]